MEYQSFLRCFNRRELPVPAAGAASLDGVGNLGLDPTLQAPNES